MSRDKLLGLLWSEGEPDKSRHALTQSLYHIRKALRVERIFLSGTDLRIDPTVLSSDVGDFLRAITEGRLGDAVALYRGPFLDGFYLNGDPDFEFWAATERDRFARSFSQSLETLAREAHEAGDRDAEISWRVRLVDQDPLNGAAMASLMTVLADAGEHGAALQRGRWHETRMRAELDLPPAPEVAELLAKLRRPSPPRGIAVPAEDAASLDVSSAPQSSAVAGAIPANAEGSTRRLQKLNPSVAWLGVAASLVFAI